MNKSPDAFRTISEVADWLGTPAHVLRFWESKFPQVKPVKRAGGRRYYRPADMLLLGGLKRLLHEDGMTIKAAQSLVREQGVKHVSEMSVPLDTEHANEPVEGDLAEDPGTQPPMAEADSQPPEPELQTEYDPEIAAEIAAEVSQETTPEPVADDAGGANLTGLPPVQLEEAEMAFEARRKAREDADAQTRAQETAEDTPAQTSGETAEFEDRDDDDVDLPFLPPQDVSPAPGPAPSADQSDSTVPFLRAAPLALDEHAEAQDIPPQDAEPLVDLTPTGPVRTDLLREALMAAGGLEPARLRALNAQLTDLRNRMGDALGKTAGA